MYEHNALGYWSGLALCLTKSEAVEHAVLRQLLFGPLLQGLEAYCFAGVVCPSCHKSCPLCNLKNFTGLLFNIKRHAEHKNHNSGLNIFSSPEPLGSQGELIGWP